MRPKDLARGWYVRFFVPSPVDALEGVSSHCTSPFSVGPLNWKDAFDEEKRIFRRKDTLLCLF